MPVFKHRSSEPEVMDNLACSGDLVRQTLRELETINALLGGNRATLRGIAALAVRARRDLHIIDLGCGGGDMLRLIRKWSARRNIDPTLTGIDANPYIVQDARDHTPGECRISFECIDIFSDAFREKTFDIATATLFFHHFTDEQLTGFFRQLLGQVRVGFVINDIHRHPAAYYSIAWLTKLFSKSSMVKNDAPLSVLRAFKRQELERILDRAGCRRFRIRWMWAFRWQVIVWKA